MEESKIEEKQHKAVDILDITTYEEVEKSSVVPCSGKKKRKLTNLKSRVKIFEHYLSKKPKGTFKVWFTDLKLSEYFNVKLFVHVVVDSKICYRLSTKYAAFPLVPLQVTVSGPKTSKKRKIEIRTSGAQRICRQEMGHNDQSDVKHQKLGLSTRYFRRWPQKLFAKI